MGSLGKEGGGLGKEGGGGFWANSILNIGHIRRLDWAFTSETCSRASKERVKPWKHVWSSRDMLISFPPQLQAPFLWLRRRSGTFFKRSIIVHCCAPWSDEVVAQRGGLLWLILLQRSTICNNSFRNLGSVKRSVAQTSQATVLLMPSQAFLKRTIEAHPQIRNDELVGQVEKAAEVYARYFLNN